MSKPVEYEQVRYGILLPDGKLATLETEDNDGRDCCGAVTYRLSDDQNLPPWTTDNPIYVGETLFADSHWFNSSPQKPCWGKFKGEQLRPAKVVTIVTEAPEIKPPVSIASVSVRDLPHSLARKYSKIDNLPRQGKRYVIVLVAQTVDELSANVGQEVCFDESLYNRRKIVAVQPMTDEYDGPVVKEAKTILVCEAL